MKATPGYRRLFAAIVGVVALLVVLAQPLPAAEPAHGMLFGATTDFCCNASLDRLDPVTGSQISVATLSGLAKAMVADPTSRLVYAVVGGGGKGGPPVSEMLTIDTATGSVAVTQNVSAFAMVFDTATHMILALDYKLDGLTVSTEVDRIDPATGTKTLIASLPDRPGALAFDTASRSLYAETFGRAPLVGSFSTVNADTGVVTSGPTLDPAVDELIFDDAARALFGFAGYGTRRFVQINPSTGGETAIGSFSFNGLAPAATIDSVTHTVYLVENDFVAGQWVGRIATINDQTGANTLSPDMAKRMTAIAFQPPSITPETIEAEVRAALASGAIDNEGIARSLLAKLNEAAGARTSGQCGAAAETYGAFIDELGAQSGKHIESATAAKLIGEAQFLIAHCP